MNACRRADWARSVFVEYVLGYKTCNCHENLAVSVTRPLAADADQILTRTDSAGAATVAIRAVFVVDAR